MVAHFADETLEFDVAPIDPTDPADSPTTGGAIIVGADGSTHQVTPGALLHEPQPTAYALPQQLRMAPVGLPILQEFTPD